MIVWEELIRAMLSPDLGLFSGRETFRPETLLQRDLGISTEGLMSLVMFLEERFGVSIGSYWGVHGRDPVSKGTLTLGQLFNEINSRLGACAGAQL